MMNFQFKKGVNLFHEGLLKISHYFRFCPISIPLLAIYLIRNKILGIKIQIQLKSLRLTSASIF